MTLQQQIENAQTTQELTACLERVKALEWEAEMADDFRSAHNELTECKKLHDLIKKRMGEIQK